MGGLDLSGVWWGSGRGVEGNWRVSGGHLVCVWSESRRVLEGVREMSWEGYGEGVWGVWEGSRWCLGGFPDLFQTPTRHPLDPHQTPPDPSQTSTRHPPDPFETPPDTAQTPHRPPPDTHQTPPRHLPDAGSPFHVWACRSYCQGSRIPMYMSTLYAGHLRLCLQATLTF